MTNKRNNPSSKPSPLSADELRRLADLRSHIITNKCDELERLKLQVSFLADFIMRREFPELTTEQASGQRFIVTVDATGKRSLFDQFSEQFTPIPVECVNWGGNGSAVTR